MGKPAVWFVDDLSSNRQRFRDNHQDAFIVTTFREPAEVMDELEQMGPPDALLCDIYFYESEEQAKRIEEQIGNAAARLRALAGDLGAGKKDAQAGIRLIEDVTNYFKGDPPFPLQGLIALSNQAHAGYSKEGIPPKLNGVSSAATSRH